jgi:hypothetical protein
MNSANHLWISIRICAAEELIICISWQVLLH